jgi:hypothetical protein
MKIAEEVRDKFSLVLGKKDSERFNDSVIELMKKIDDNTNANGEFIDKVGSHLDVYSSMRVSPEKYVKACEFVMHFLFTKSKSKSYKLTFPERSKELIESGASIANSANVYFISKLVQTIIAQSAISLGLTHQSKIHDSVDVLHYIAMNSENERLRMESADKLLNHLTIEDQNKFVHEVHQTGGTRDFIGEMEEQMISMREEMKAKMLAGYDVKEVVNSKIIEAEVFD